MTETKAKKKETVTSLGHKVDAMHLDIKGVREMLESLRSPMHPVPPTLDQPVLPSNFFDSVGEDDILDDSAERELFPKDTIHIQSAPCYSELTDEQKRIVLDCMSRGVYRDKGNGNSEDKSASSLQVGQANRMARELGVVVFYEMGQPMKEACQYSSAAMSWLISQLQTIGREFAAEAYTEKYG